MNKTKLALATVATGLPAVGISLYITYFLLSQVDADRLIWFLFFMQIPLSIIAHILTRIITNE